VAWGCSPSGEDGSSSDETSDSTTSETSGGEPSETGTLSTLSYNVAGLPEGISGSHPEANTPLMSPLLNGYELVLVQEDFTYHAELSADVEHPFVSEAHPAEDDVGDGLNRFSDTSFSDFLREAWEQCNGQFDSGSDCLTSKGFSVSLHELAPGVQVDVYNLHMDAGGGDADIEAREAQTQQLLDTIHSRSEGRALIVAGDTNMKESSEYIFEAWLADVDLVDACRQLDCGEPFRIDRVMYRSSDTLILEPTSWQIAEEFVDGEGEPLSDHEAVAVDFEWSLTG
jgi:hypothetical protein